MAFFNQIIDGYPARAFGGNQIDWKKHCKPIKWVPAKKGFWMKVTFELWKAWRDAPQGHKQIWWLKIFRCGFWIQIYFINCHFQFFFCEPNRIGTRMLTGEVCVIDTSHPDYRRDV